MKNVKRFLALLLVMVSIGAICLPAAPVAEAATSLYWPVPGHTSLSRGFSDSHGGLDINDGSINGAKVIAAMSGTITRITKCTENHSGSYGDCNGSGTGVGIYGDDGRTYSYAHMQSGSIPSNFKVGTYVTAGTQIGRVGNTGNSTGPHLHFSIAKGKKYWENLVDPSKETYIYTAGEVCYFADLPSKVSIGNNDAVIAQKLNKQKGTTPTKYGARLYDKGGNLLGSVSDTISGYTNSTYIDMWWTVSTGLKVKLWPGQTYQYEFWATVDGITYTSLRRTFTTTGTAPTITLNYNANGGSGSMSATKVALGGTTNLRTNTFTKPGYSFAGWHVLRGDGRWIVEGNRWLKENEFTSGDTKRVFSDGLSIYMAYAWYVDQNQLYDYTFYAVWEKDPNAATYTFSYNTNGGTGTFSKQTVQFGDQFYISATIPTRTGYTFKGWNVLRTGDNAWYCATVGWKTDAQITASGYEKKLYRNENGVYKFDNSWVNGCETTPGYTFYAVWEMDETFTGIVNRDGALYYVKKGKVATGVTSLIKYEGIWYYVKNGKVATEITDLVKYNGEWWYVVKGQVASNMTDLVKYNGEWWYVVKGKLATNTTTLIKWNGAWYYITKGKLAGNTTNLIKYNGEWWYVVKGRVASEVTDLVKYNGEWFYVVKGKIASNTTKLVQFNGGWYYMYKGKLAAKTTTLVKHNGSWYYVVNGKVNFSYNGKVLYNGTSYNVKNGKVV